MGFGACAVGSSRFFGLGLAILPYKNKPGKKMVQEVVHPSVVGR